MGPKGVLSICVGNGLCGSNQAVHHCPIQPLWSDSRCSCRFSLEVQSAGLSSSATSNRKLTLSLNCEGNPLELKANINCLTIICIEIRRYITVMFTT